MINQISVTETHKKFLSFNPIQSVIVFNFRTRVTRKTNTITDLLNDLCQILILVSLLLGAYRFHQTALEH